MSKVRPPACPDLNLRGPLTGKHLQPVDRPAAPLFRPAQELCLKGLVDDVHHRHLFVQRHLSPAEQNTLRRITRGLPALRTLRQIVEQAYQLFDRRCRTETALAKLARLRQRVARFSHLRQTLKKLFSPNLEKALTFLDDALLPATSNAVERGNRRHRKMQKAVYRVRTSETIRGRIALDMQRDLQAPTRLQTTVTLHQQRHETG